ncbi:MAG: transcriptional repressor LexA [Gammaproteobacteria bacterium]|nr:transcriptional repressor LexA [Gammaproteobacteria bacterium]
MVSRAFLPADPLSPRQRQILQLIERHIERHGMPPTRAELAAALGLRNRQGIDQHLRALARKHRIGLEPGIARGIRLRGGPGTSRAGSQPRLPLYGRVAAGVPTLASSNIENELLIDPALFRPAADFLLRVHGNSMRDADILDRDILAVHRTATVSNGQIVVARLGEEATVKIYRRRGSLLRLEPANDAYAPLEIDLATQTCVIEGLVVGIVRAGLPQRR